MNNSLDESDLQRWLVWSSLYAVVMLVIAGFVNYTEPYSLDPVANTSLWQLMLWGSLYLPVILLPILAGWKVTEFGFTLNPFLALTVALLVTFCIYFTPAGIVTWRSAVIEAFARTGEEIFFRGFLFVLISLFFRNRRRPWLWAAIGSSILFALAHTQMFQPGFMDRYGSPLLSVGYQIAQRLLNLFGFAFVLALLRVWTRSILPGAIAHSLSKAGIATLPVVLLIYGAATLWAHRRAEPVILQAEGIGRLV